ncbi:cation:proton antiporter domain-containing protein [Brevirhabdus sp.]|uniref:cation:proton antiporter domain-containing protein n=1 Tax=Brevirhabdus sp. TaxID=2004514 RepID=UPI004059F143
MEAFLIPAAVYLAAAVVAVPLATRLGLGSVLGYLLAGIAIGPLTGLVGEETQDLQHIAEFGVVMMLFVIGLELDPRALWEMRHRLLGLGGLQVLGTMGVVTSGAMALGMDWESALAIGMVFALSSTAIVLQTLTEKRLLRTAGGNAGFSVLLMQDIAVIPMLTLLPLLALPHVNNLAAGGKGAAASEKLATAGGNSGEAKVAAEAAMSVVESMPGWGVALVTLAAVAGIILFGIFATRPLFRFLHMARLRELYVAFALLTVVGIAALMMIVGLSPALGTFLAGVVLANSEFRHELQSDIEPFKGLFLGLFFITVGAGINFTVFFAAPVKLLGLTLAMMAAKGMVLYLLALAFRLRGRDRWLFTLGLAQAGEFGFVLISVAIQQNVVPSATAEALLLMVALSMLITPLFFIVYEALSARIGDAAESQAADEIDEKGEVIIAGVGRFGQVINRLVQGSGYRTVVLDHNLKTIQLMRRFGFKGFFGDPGRPELLHAAGLMEARVLIVALDDPQAATRLVDYARRTRPDLHIIARARDRVHVYELYRAGADEIVRELFDSALRAGRYALERLGLSDFEARETARSFYRLDRAALRDLAELWTPDTEMGENSAYIERSKQLNKELEAALVTQIRDRRRKNRDPEDEHEA